MDHKAWIEAHAIARRQDAERAEDLAQDLAVAALEHRGGVRSLGAWLERVGRNAAIDRWRVEGRRRELAGAIEPPGASPDPEAVLLCREQRRLVRRALGELPRPQRRAALARFHADLPFEEIARRLGTPVVTARTRVHRALAGLRARLGGLRVWFLWPGGHATVLGIALLAVNAPALVPRLSAEPGPAPAVTAASPRRRAVAQANAREEPLARATSIGEPASARAPVAAPGETRTPHREPRPAPSESVPPPQLFVFGSDRIEGEVAGPDGETIRVARAAVQPSLIEIRRHFVAEVLKSLEDL